MNPLSIASRPAVSAGDEESRTAAVSPRALLGIGLYLLALVAAATLTAFAAEAILRRSFSEAALFLVDLGRPGWPTVAFLALVMLGIDAFTRRRGQSILIVAPLVLTLAWVGREKGFYLGDPIYPTDFLYARQIIELLPLMLVERPMVAMAIAVGVIVAAVLLVFLWRRTVRFPRIGITGRAARLAVAAPLLGYFAMQMDYATHSDLRSRLNISPMMWDQKANYRHNGLVMAFALNVPMAYVAPPAGYSPAAIEHVAAPAAPAYVPAARPDIIMVMSESFWDPTRLPGVTLEPDPIAFTRSIQSGHIFSPEFGGMTSNVEFEALTGFSNALLPYGSIPYQQYVRRETPSLASFFDDQGYETLAIHPFLAWFWNRGPVYDAFGFERFLSEEDIGKLPKQGRLASDEALTDLIIKEAEAANDPLFLFAVTLQNHGPYEPGRYEKNTIAVETDAGQPTREAIATFAQGMKDSDDSLRRLVEWAEKRERETIIVYFGDHLPPLGPHYVATGFMDSNVGDRFAPPHRMAEQRETPLGVWSNREGTIEDIGSISPAFLPVHLLEAAGMQHPYYTGFLGKIHETYRVLDRHVAIKQNGRSVVGWNRDSVIDPLLRDYRLVQYDILFGDMHAVDGLFDTTDEAPLVAAPVRPPRRGTGHPL